MRKIIALLLALLMLCSLAACKGGEQEEQSDVPVNEETSHVTSAPDTEKQEAEESSQKGEPGTAQSSVQDDAETEHTDPEPSQGLDAYEFPADHPHDGKKLSVFDGIYRASVPMDDMEETWVEVTGFNDFILLEYFGVIESSVCSFEAEEFWPDDGWYTDTTADAVSGKSQRFSSMGPENIYYGLPKACEIRLTEDGLELVRAEKSEKLVRDDSLTGGHTDAETMRSVLGDSVHLDFDYQYDSSDAVGNWGYWNGDTAMNLQLLEDGTFKLFRKNVGKPIEVYKGVYGFGEYSGNLVVFAERVGFGGQPYIADLEWYVDEIGINLSDEEGVFFDAALNFWKVESEFFTAFSRDRAVGYVTECLQDEGTYTDKYDTEYIYSYSVPKFYPSDNLTLEEINNTILSDYVALVEEEYNAMSVNEFISYDYVNWEIDAYEGILFLHVYAMAYDWEEHSVYYIDTETMTLVEPLEMLERIGLSEQEFLDTVRARAEEMFEMTFADIPEEERDVYGYYECLEETVSEACVNTELPVYVDHFGDIRVYLKISSPAGTGLIFVPDYPFGITDEGEGIG